MELNEAIAAYVYFQAAKLIDKVGENLKIRIDLFHQKALQANRDRFYKDENKRSITNIPLAELLSPLVIETDGTIVPIQHGMERKYALGNLKQSNLPQLAYQWREEKYLAFHQLRQQVYQDLMFSREFPIINWYREIFEQAASA